MTEAARRVDELEGEKGAPGGRGRAWGAVCPLGPPPEVRGRLFLMSDAEAQEPRRILHGGPGGAGQDPGHALSLRRRGLSGHGGPRLPAADPRPVPQSVRWAISPWRAAPAPA